MRQEGENRDLRLVFYLSFQRVPGTLSTGSSEALPEAVAGIGIIQHGVFLRPQRNYQKATGSLRLTHPCVAPWTWGQPPGLPRSSLPSCLTTVNPLTQALNLFLVLFFRELLTDFSIYFLTDFQSVSLHWLLHISS